MTSIMKVSNKDPRGLELCVTATGGMQVVSSSAYKAAQRQGLHWGLFDITRDYYLTPEWGWEKCPQNGVIPDEAQERHFKSPPLNLKPQVTVSPVNRHQSVRGDLGHDAATGPHDAPLLPYYRAGPSNPSIPSSDPNDYPQSLPPSQSPSQQSSSNPPGYEPRQNPTSFYGSESGRTETNVPYSNTACLTSAIGGTKPSSTEADYSHKKGKSKKGKSETFCALFGGLGTGFGAVGGTIPENMRGL